MSDIVIPISLGNEKPPIEPVRGEMRVVKMIQTMEGWKHCIWISPYTFQDEIKPGEMGPCRRCAVLMDAGTCERPQMARIAMWTVPDCVLGEHAPAAPINW